MDTYCGPGILRFRRVQAPSHYTFEVTGVSLLIKQGHEVYDSEVFEAGGYKWKLIFYPNGIEEESTDEEENTNEEENTDKNYISLYLTIEDTDSLPEKWEVNVDFRLFVSNHIDQNYLSIQDVLNPIKTFKEGTIHWGFKDLLELETFKDPTKGYLVNDSCTLGAEIFVIESAPKLEHLLVKQKGGLLRKFRDLGPAHFSFTIDSFSSLCEENSEIYESDIFSSGGFKWRLCIYLKENQKTNKKELSVYLKIVETEDLSKNWHVFPTFTFFIYDHIKDRFLTFQDLDGKVKRYHELKKDWGLNNLISLEDFQDASNGFLVGDRCTLGAEVLVIKQEGQIVEKALVVAAPVVKEGETMFIWKIENISNLAGKDIYSEPFTMCGATWKVEIYPTGYMDAANKSVSLYLYLHEPEKLPPNQEIQIDYTVRLRDQLEGSHYKNKVGRKTFSSKCTNRGFRSFITLERLDDTSLGFKKDDTIFVEVVVDSFCVFQATTG